MRILSGLLLAATLAAVLLLTCTPTSAARRLGGSANDGTWSVAIYTLRGDCGSVRVAVRIVSGRVYSEDQSYRARGGLGKPSPVLADPQRALAGCRAIPAQEVGGHLEENAPAVGQPRDAQVISAAGNAMGRCTRSVKSEHSAMRRKLWPSPAKPHRS
jgi:hypothetical protein